MPKFFSVPAGSFVADNTALHYWPLQEGLGDPLTDQRAAGYAHADFTSSGISWGTPKFNGWDAPIFNGSNAYATLGDKLDLGTSDFNFAIWVYIDGEKEDPNPLISKTNGSLDSSLGYAIDLGPYNWVVRLKTASSGEQPLNIGKTHGIPLNVWTHIAFTVDRNTNRLIRYYKNGLYVNSGTIPNVSPTANLSNSISHYLGRAVIVNTTYYFLGSMSQCLWSASYPVWSDGDVWRIYKNAR